MPSRVYRHDLCIYGGGSKDKARFLSGEPRDLWHDITRLRFYLVLFWRDYRSIFYDMQ